MFAGTWWAREAISQGPGKRSNNDGGSGPPEPLTAKAPHHKEVDRRMPLEGLAQ